MYFFKNYFTIKSVSAVKTSSTTKIKTGHPSNQFFFLKEHYAECFCFLNVSPLNPPIFVSPSLPSELLLIPPSLPPLSCRTGLEVGGVMSWQSNAERVDTYRDPHSSMLTWARTHTCMLHTQSQSPGSVCVCAESSCKASGLLL